LETKIEIQKKSKPVSLIIFFFVLVGTAGIWVLLRFIYPTLPGFWDLKLSAIGAIVGAVFVGIYSVKKHSNNKVAGLTIDESGITDCSNLASVGFIPWSDIESVKQVKGDFNRTLIAVMVKNPEGYINKSSKMAASRQMQFQQFGSPILINMASLDYPVQQLMTLLNDHLK
jgi:hypothetical protein